MMIEDRAKQDDMHVGVVFATLHPSNGRVSWCFKAYDPDDHQSFPVSIQFKQAGKLFIPKNPGEILEIENDDALVVFVDRAYTHPELSRYVSLDYEAGKVPDPQKPDEQVQMIGANRVNGIPTNIDPEKWVEVFFEERPALLFRKKPAALRVA
jgi:hypothetical protein